MIKKTIQLNMPNWLSCDCEIRLQSAFVNLENYETSLENGKLYVKSGTIITYPIYGILLSDTEVTKKTKECGVVVSGRYIDSKLPKSAVDYVDIFISQGLYAVDEGSFVRPDFEDDDKPTPPIPPTPPTPSEFEVWQEGDILYINNAEVSQIGDTLEVQ